MEHAVGVRRLITGTDDEGRSSVVARIENDTAGSGPSPPMAAVFERRSVATASRASGSAPLIELGVEPGDVRWIAVNFEPAGEAPVHHTDTIDFTTVLSGSIELLLDDGDHVLRAGDSIVVNGIDHGWRAGPEGCTMNVVLVGVPPRDR